MLKNAEKRGFSGDFQEKKKPCKTIAYRALGGMWAIEDSNF
jgi:hypothetical protein